MNDYIEGRIKLDDGGSFGVRGEKLLLELEETPIELRRGSMILHVAPQYRKWARSGWIRSVGEGVDPLRYDFLLGQKVFFGTSMVGHDIEIDNKAYKIITPECVLGVMPEEARG